MEKPRALAQVLHQVQSESDACKVDACKKLFDQLEIKIFNIEQNLMAEMNLLRENLDDYGKGSLCCQLQNVTKSCVCITNSC